MGENDHLGGALGDVPDLLNRRQCPMFVQARDRVVNDDDFVHQALVLVE